MGWSFCLLKTLHREVTEREYPLCRNLTQNVTRPKCGLRLRILKMSFNSSSVCWFGWWCGRRERSMSDTTDPSYRLRQRYTVARETLKRFMAAWMENLWEYPTTDWRNRAICDIVSMDSELAPLRFLVVLKLYHMERLVRYLFLFLCLTSIVILQFWMR